MQKNVRAETARFQIKIWICAKKWRVTEVVKMKINRKNIIYFNCFKFINAKGVITYYGVHTVFRIKMHDKNNKLWESRKEHIFKCYTWSCISQIYIYIFMHTSECLKIYIFRTYITMYYMFWHTCIHDFSISYLCAFCWKFF